MKKEYLKPWSLISNMTESLPLLGGSPITSVVEVKEEDGTFEKEGEDEVINAKYHPFVPWSDVEY